jgi:hypothetical protein
MAERISIEFDGKTYAATYTVERDIVTVHTAFDQKSTQVGGSPPETLAMTMLREMAQAARRRGDDLV